jgi:hypothetical protein
VHQKLLKRSRKKCKSIGSLQQHSCSRWFAWYFLFIFKMNLNVCNFNLKLSSPISKRTIHRFLWAVLNFLHFSDTQIRKFSRIPVLFLLFLGLLRVGEGYLPHADFTFTSGKIQYLGVPLLFILLSSFSLRRWSLGECKLCDLNCVFLCACVVVWNIEI